MKLFDLHCDTPLELYKQGKKLASNDLHVSLEKAGIFDKYIQCAAVFSGKELSDEECFQRFCDVSSYFKAEAGDMLVYGRKDLEKAKKAAFILTVEDSRLVCPDIGRIQFLFDCGVRVMTLLWGSRSTVGSAWNCDGALTPLGKEILEGCFDTGIIPDISHANDEVSAYVIRRSKERKKPIIATHSNSRAVHPHMRNLTDKNARALSEAGGIIGISLYPPHLRGETADISDIIDHIEHYTDLLGTDAVCLGCDFDGIGSTPEGISHIGHLPRLYESLSKRLNSCICEKVFFTNAYNFFINNLPKDTQKQ